MTKTISASKVIKLPRRVGVCPACGADLWIDISEWTQLRNGAWIAGECGVMTECTKEPDLAHRKAWMAWYHTHMGTYPPMLWKLSDKAYRWLRRNYRFEVNNSDA